MGLLGQILGGLAENMSDRSTTNGGLGGGLGGLGGALGGGLPGGLGGLGGALGGRSGVLMALLPVVLGMLANRNPSASGGGLPGAAGGMGGGLGGLGALLEQFTQKGYGESANSWIGTGANQPIPPEALSDVFGQDQLAQIASQAGVSEEDARSGLSELLPEVVDHFTPTGQLPGQDDLSSSVDDYIRGLNLPR